MADLVRHATHEETLNPAQPAAAHDQQVGFFIVDDLEDHGCRVAILKGGLDRGHSLAFGILLRMAQDLANCRAP